MAERRVCNVVDDDNDGDEDDVDDNNDGDTDSRKRKIPKQTNF